MKADKAIQQKTLEQCEKYKQLLHESTDKMNALQTKVGELEISQDQLESLQLYTQNLKAENESLTHLVDNLTQTTLQNEQVESKRINQLVLQYKQEITELQSAIQQANTDNSYFFFKKDHCLKKNMQIFLSAKIKEELSKTSTSLSDALKEKAQLLKNKETVYDIFKTLFGLQLESEVEASKNEISKLKQRTSIFETNKDITMKDLQDALALIQKAKKKNILNFLEPTELDTCQDIVKLKEKMEELQSHNRDLILESKQYQTLLDTQININKKKILNYCILKKIHLKKNNIKLLFDKKYIILFLQSSVFGGKQLFNQNDIDEVAFSTTENMLVIQVTQAQLNPDFIGNDPLTMIVVDFFEVKKENERFRI
ncbi:hypothetical protein RFI_02804 [Reticulomyxa filosa]|uniref:Uncharacterized protein n=1 Tax=Reticulomyxa filosa TaxID=46433 RepID=X6P853_RETFI|nr:hypothetical protein RFI_02804 [Reticulomyxa filosa]|eukprot:ETO34293.1 hypothetical protein RFI_02804 [Reticulomyxa filosa]